MLNTMQKFLKDFDSYGYKKILCEELLTREAPDHNLEVVALRLADVIGPYDDSYRFWKYVTWIKTLLGLPSRLSPEVASTVKTKIRYEVPRDLSSKLSFTFSVDVVRMLMA